MNTFFKIFAVLFTILFVWSAFVQINDPDPYVWIFIYLFAAVLSIIFFLDKLPYKLTFIIATIYLLAGILNWPNVFEGVSIGEGKIKNIEEGRESLGLLFCSAIIFIYSFRVKYTKKS